MDTEEGMGLEEGARPASTPVDANANDSHVDPARKAFVAEWAGRVRHAKSFHKKAFERIDWCSHFARNGAEKPWITAENYTVAVVQRHINQAVAQLYAKNPTAVANPRRKLLTPSWDGKLETLQAAFMAAQAGDLMAGALVQEVVGAQNYLRMVNQLAKTMELLHAYFLSEQKQSYKRKLKALVRRAKVCGVGYIKLGFQRLMKQNPEFDAKIADARDRIAQVELLMKQGADLPDDSPRIEELRATLADLEGQQFLILREGPVLDFPRATEIIVDPECRHLASFEGASWIAHEFDMTPDRVFKVYGVEVGDTFARYSESEAAKKVYAKGDRKVECMKVWEIWHEPTGMVFTIADGYPDYLREPASPDVQLERFWPIFPITFNEVETEGGEAADDSIYPPSDVWMLRHAQKEYNRAREELRLHRQANRPGYATPAGALEEEDKKKLANRETNAVLELKGLLEGDDIRQKLAALPNVPIDPVLYDTSTQYEDILRTVGTQEANLGGTSDATATESSIAENSRQTSMADNVDELDDVLTELAKAMGEVMLLNLSKDTVIEIVGPGAVWPESLQSREELVKDLLLETKAGSSGRPNQAAEIAKFERAAPWVVQMPGVNPRPLAEKVLDMMEIDVEDRIIEGLPSITALNAAANKPPPQEPGKNPGDQGGEGGQNAPNPQVNEPGGQPAYPAQGGQVPLA